MPCHEAFVDMINNFHEHYYLWDVTPYSLIEVYQSQAGCLLFGLLSNLEDGGNRFL
jgi:hypothetical protein